MDFHKVIYMEIVVIIKYHVNVKINATLEWMDDVQVSECEYSCDFMHQHSYHYDDKHILQPIK